ncbi:MAG: hypothetical protein LBC74_11255 [Planctomycetaceae bacterium]|nr:hypothetical protein [Planctomycetaceae bacterium]
MNPVQRAVMTNYLRPNHHAIFTNCHNKDENLPNSEKLYNTIQLFQDKPKTH